MGWFGKWIKKFFRKADERWWLKTQLMGNHHQLQSYSLLLRWVKGKGAKIRIAEKNYTAVRWNEFWRAFENGIPNKQLDQGKISQDHLLFYVRWGCRFSIIGHRLIIEWIKISRQNWILFNRIWGWCWKTNVEIDGRPIPYRKAYWSYWCWGSRFIVYVNYSKYLLMSFISLFYSSCKQYLIFSPQ